MVDLQEVAVHRGTVRECVGQAAGSAQASQAAQAVLKCFDADAEQGATVCPPKPHKRVFQQPQPPRGACAPLGAASFDVHEKVSDCWHAAAGMISPRSPYKRAWDWLVILVVVATTMVTPLDLSFFDSACNSTGSMANTKPVGEYLLLLDACQLDLQLGNASVSGAAYEASRFHLRPACRSSLLGALDYALDAVFWADILATFATGVQKERSTDINYDAFHVAGTYLRGALARDIVSGVPWDLIAVASGGAGSGQRGMGLKLLRLPRLLRLSRIIQKLQHLSSSNGFRILLFMVVYVVIAHWAACLFHYMSKWQIWNASDGWVDVTTGAVPWLVYNCLQYSGAVTRYTASLYWALTTMVTVGYGDITPVTNMERCFTMVLQLLAGVLQGVVFGNIGLALQGFDRANSSLQERLRDMQCLARQQSLPDALAVRMQDSTCALWRQAHGFDAASLMGCMGGSLHSDVLASLDYSAALKATPLFCDAPPGFMRALLARLRVLAYLPGEVVVDAGDPGTEMYFVHAGAVRLLSFAHSGEDAVLGTGEIFGEVDTILCQRRSARAVAEAPGGATLYALSRDDFDAVLAQFPELVGILTDRCLSREAMLRRGSSEGSWSEEAPTVQEGGEEAPPPHVRSDSRGAGDTLSTAEASALAARQRVLLRVDSKRLPLAAASQAESASVRAGSAAAAAARWSRAASAARFLELQSNAAATSFRVDKEASIIHLTPRFVDHTPRPLAARAPPLASQHEQLNWTVLETRIRAVMRAQAGAHTEAQARLGTLLLRQDELVRQAAALAM